MASDLSSECTETAGLLDEKEEGEISLEDVSSSEEGHLNYGHESRVTNCSNCLSTQHNTTWCNAVNKFYSKGPNRREVDLILQDAVQGKENRRHIKEPGCIGAKHTVSTLQEKNDDDLVPISSDSDMEIVGLTDNSKQIVIHSCPKGKPDRKKKKKWNRDTGMTIQNLVSPSEVDLTMSEYVNPVSHKITKNVIRSYHKDISPVRKNRSTAVRRSPPRRRRSLARTHSPVRRSKSPNLHLRTTMKRKSPKRLKSPKHSPYRSSVKTISKKPSHIELTSTRSHADTHKLLKKVRELDSIGTCSLEEELASKNKDHPFSLKEKLSNMMRGTTDNGNEVCSSLKEKSVSSGHMSKIGKTNEGDDDEDLALLRQKALETKQSKQCSKQNEREKCKTTKKVSTNINDDQDEEDLELRMIALRSAVLKKHQNRVQRGIKSGKYKKSNISHSESPFSQSFLDSITIPGEELNFVSPPHTPVRLHENNHMEDVELDTDVEKEREKLPYSPTDKITAHIPIDTELLGIQPSDVSFISLNQVSINSTFNSCTIPSSPHDQKSYQGKIIENRSYLPNIVYYAPQENSQPLTDTDVQYLRSHLARISKPDFTKDDNFHANVQNPEDTPSTPKIVGLTTNSPSESDVCNLSQELPYSPTDTPIYDPYLSHELTPVSSAITTSNSSLISSESHASNTQGNVEQPRQPLDSANQQTEVRESLSDKDMDDQSNKPEFSKALTIGCTEVMSSCDSPLNNIGPSEINTQPTKSSISNPHANVESDTSTARGLQNNSNESEATAEPFYMKAISDVTKDTSKTPTLINIPTSVLRTNKQLQVPLIKKKCPSQPERTFKSADMQPVDVPIENNVKTNSTFKPIKLSSLPQKAHSVLPPPEAFNEMSSCEVAIDQTCTNTPSCTSIADDSNNLVQTNIITKTTNCDIKTSTQKRRKQTKKAVKRKSTGAASMIPRDCSSSTMNNDANNTVLQVQTDTLNKVLLSNDKSNSSVVNRETDSGNSRLLIDNNTADQGNSTENRRQSVDEDEEALRAILLASLPKRAKITNLSKSDTITSPSTVNTVSSSVTTGTSSLPATSVTNIVSSVTPPVSSAAVTVSDSTMVQQTVSKAVTNTTNLESTMFISNMHASNSGPDHNNSGVHNIPEKVNNIITQTSLNVEKVEEMATSNMMKKLLPITKMPQKKLVKRIPASTKVVNNAKRYQNTLIQKKLSLQKATLYNKQKVMENKITSKTQSYVMKRSINGKPLAETPRIVINLQSDTESDSETERQRNVIVSSVNSATVDKSQSTVNPTTDFEKNLDQFLRDVRKKQESMAAATRPTSTSQQTSKFGLISSSKIDKTNSSGLHTTPLAVRHLPASQQEEYRRLKQQILEREKLKLHRAIENNSLNKNKVVDSSSKPASPRSPNGEQNVGASRTTSVHNQSIVTQQVNKENIVNSVKNIPITSASADLCDDRRCSVKKQGCMTSTPLKTIPKTITNVEPRISIEKQMNNPENSVAEVSPSQTLDISTIVPETPKHMIQTDTKTSPGIKILSKDEVNRKYVQVEVRKDSSEQVVTINDEVTLNKRTVISREDISENKNNRKESISDKDTNQIVKSAEKSVAVSFIQSSDNDAIDSDASTVILPWRNENVKRKTSFDTSVCTIQCSQSQEDSRTSVSSVSSNLETKRESHFLSSKNSSSLKSMKSIEESWETIKEDVKTELNTLVNLPQAEQERCLTDTEQKLVTKRYTILDDLAEMSSNLRQWHMERDLQTNLAAEVRMLREQLKVAEERLQEQRNRINDIGPKVIEAHGKINAGRRECFKLATICSTLGNRVVGKEYKVPEAGAQLLDNRLKEVANHTRQLSQKRVPSIDIPDTCALTNLKNETAIVPAIISQLEPDSLSEECNIVNSIDTTVLERNETVLNSCDIEKTVELERTGENRPERSVCASEVQLSNAVSKDSEERLEKKDNCETGTTFIDQTIPCDTSVAVIVNPNAEDQVENLDKVQKMSKSDIRSTSTVDLNKKEVTHQAKQDGERSTKKTPSSYESILTHFKVSRNTNPNGILCPYELMGTCSDGECPFVHQTESQAK